MAMPSSGCRRWRCSADDSPVDVPSEEADAAIRDADRVVGAVEVWAQPPGLSLIGLFVMKRGLAC
jgi:hypothetical protein